MAATLKKEENLIRIEYEGRIDSSTASELQEAFDEAIAAQPEKIAMDMKNTDYISSKGIRILVASMRALNGKPLVVENCNPAVKEIFRSLNLLKAFYIE